MHLKTDKRGGLIFYITNVFLVMHVVIVPNINSKFSYGIVPRSYLCFMDNFAMDSIIKTVPLSTKL